MVVESFVYLLFIFFYVNLLIHIKLFFYSFNFLYSFFMNDERTILKNNTADYFQKF